MKLQRLSKPGMDFTIISKEIKLSLIDEMEIGMQFI
jgi:hypothetical protein